MNAYETRLSVTKNDFPSRIVVLSPARWTKDLSSALCCKIRLFLSISAHKCFVLRTYEK